MKECAPTLPMKSQKKNSKVALWRNLAFLLGVLALGILIYDIGLDTIADNVLSMGIHFVYILLVWALVYLTNAMSWYIIIRDDKVYTMPSFWRVFKLTVSGYTLNYVTPFGLAGGEPYRILELKRDMPTTKASSSVILYAMMHICSHFIFWLFSAIFFAFIYPLNTMMMIVLSVMFIVSTLIITLFFKGYKYGFVVSITKIASRVPFLGKKIANLKSETREKLVVIDQEIANLKGTRIVAFYVSLGLEFVARLVSCYEIFIIVNVLGQPMDFMGAYMVVAFSSLLANLLFFFPMQIGAREGGIYLALEAIGLNPVIAVSVSLITRIREAFWIAIGILLMKFDK